MDDPTTSRVHVSSLQKVFRSGSGEFEALHDVTFSVADRELVCLIGPSGAGKSTLLKCIAGLLPPTSGDIWVDGERVNSPPSGMAVVFQEYGRSLFPWLTVRQNVELPLKRKGLDKDRRARLVQDSLTAVELAEFESSYPWQLSGGMQQRVAIARAVAYEPTVLLMDEPFAAVDAQTRASLEDLVRRLWDTFEITVLFITHDIEEAIYIGTRVLVLSMAPTVLLKDVAIRLPDRRDQLSTRSLSKFLDYRGELYELIQRAKAPRGMKDESIISAEAPSRAI